MNRNVLGAFGLGCILLAGPALAEEGGLYGGPIGGSDIGSALLPPSSGLYGAVYGLNVTGGTFVGDDGNPSRGINPDKLRGYYGGVALRYVYPFKLWGGTLASSYSQSYEFSTLRIPTVGGGSNSGFNDAYADILFWSKNVGLFGAEPGEPGSTPHPLPYGLTIGMAMSVTIPDGRYSVGQIQSEGHNVWIWTPNISLTYTTGPNLSLGDATEISARLYYEAPTKNEDDNYQSGDLFDIDWAVSERFGRWQIGAAGAFAKELGGDYLANGQEKAPNGYTMTKVLIGPVVAYDLPWFPATLKVKAVYPIAETNALEGKTVIAALGFKLF